MKKVLVICCFVSGIAAFLSCLKEADLSTLTTTEVSNIKTQSALFGGNVVDDGGAKVELRGFCFGTADNPTVTNSTTYYCKGGTGSFTRFVPYLVPDTYYHVRAFAMNSAGTAYGNEVHFTTLPFVEPKVTTTSVGVIGYASARADGNIECNDGTTVMDKGFCLATTENPTNKDKMVQRGLGVGSYYCWLDGLQAGTIYHVRAYAVTLSGITYGADICFKTCYPPTVTTAVTKFTRTSAIVEGNIIWPDGSPGSIWDWGICYGIEPNPRGWYDIWDYLINYGVLPFIKDGVFTFPLTDLTPGTPYYVRAFITIGDGFPTYAEFTQYGNEVTFTTSQ
jgi:hypothetical protein